MITVNARWYYQLTNRDISYVHGTHHDRYVYMLATLSGSSYYKHSDDYHICVMMSVMIYEYEYVYGMVITWVL